MKYFVAKIALSPPEKDAVVSVICSSPEEAKTLSYNLFENPISVNVKEIRRDAFESAFGIQEENSPIIRSNYVWTPD